MQGWGCLVVYQRLDILHTEVTEYEFERNALTTKSSQQARAPKRDEIRIELRETQKEHLAKTYKAIDLVKEISNSNGKNMKETE